MDRGEIGRDVVGEGGCESLNEDVALYTLPTSANSVAAGEAHDTEIRFAEEMGMEREVTEASAAALAPKAKRALVRGESERVGWSVGRGLSSVVVMVGPLVLVVEGVGFGSGAAVVWGRG